MPVSPVNDEEPKLCLEQSLDAEPLGGAPRRGESGEGNAARINPSFSAIYNRVYSLPMSRLCPILSFVTPLP